MNAVHRRDRRPLTRVVVTVLQHQTHRVSGSYLLATKCTFPKMEVHIKRGKVHSGRDGVRRDRPGGNRGTRDTNSSFEPQIVKKQGCGADRLGDR